MSSLSSYFHRIPAWNEALLGDAQVLLDGPDMAHLNSRKSNLDQNINSLNGRQVVSLASTHIALLRQTYLPKNSLSCSKKHRCSTSIVFKGTTSRQAVIYGFYGYGAMGLMEHQLDCCPVLCGPCKMCMKLICQAFMSVALIPSKNASGR